MENLNIVIVGHVDHGKSSLIGRLFFDTGCFSEEKIEEIKKTCEMQGREFEYSYIMDALEEERDQGITIDTAQTYFKSEKRHYTIIDAPGHVEFVKNMLTGASLAEAGILVVDAEEGIQEQTKRHLFLLSLIGIKQVIVVLNKIDKINYDNFVIEKLKKQILDLFKEISLVPENIIPISARKGDNIINKSKNFKYQGLTVLEALDNFKKIIVENSNTLCYPIQDIYKNGDKRILVGRIESGELYENQELLFLPSYKKAKIKSIENFHKNIKKIGKGFCTGITIDKPLFIERGEIVTDCNEKLIVSDEIKVKLIWLTKNIYDEKMPLKLCCSTQESKCSFLEIEKIIDSSDFKEKQNNLINEFDVIFLKIKLKNKMVFSDFIEIPELGRFTITIENNVIAGGIII